MVAFPVDYYLSQTPISVKCFHQFILDTGYLTDAQKVGCSKVFSNGVWEKVEGLNYLNAWQNDNCPATCVSLNDARAYCAYLNESHVFSEYGIARVPTEDLWEFAARDLEGCHALDRVAWFDANSQLVLHPNQQKDPNRYGLYDLFGNVAEWTDTRYDEMNLKEEDLFVTKGASFLASPEKISLFYRGKAKASSHCYYSGFRIAVCP